LKKIYMRSS